MDLTLGSRVRCLLVWLAVGTGAGLTVAWAAPDLQVPGAGRPFAGDLVALAAWALTGCAAWAWAVTTMVVAETLAGTPRVNTPGVPRWLRAGVLVACGVAVVGLGGTAQASDRSASAERDPRAALAGLPFPERVPGGLRPPVQAPIPPGGPSDGYVVRGGDTLWDIAAADLGAGADDALVATHWRRIHELNRAVIGADPDLIHPGQRLRLPGRPQHR